MREFDKTGAKRQPKSARHGDKMIQRSAQARKQKGEKKSSASKAMTLSRATGKPFDECLKIIKMRERKAKKAKAPIGTEASVKAEPKVFLGPGVAVKKNTFPVYKKKKSVKRKKRSSIKSAGDTPKHECPVWSGIRSQTHHDQVLYP